MAGGTPHCPRQSIWISMPIATVCLAAAAAALIAFERLRTRAPDAVGVV